MRLSFIAIICACSLHNFALRAEIINAKLAFDATWSDLNNFNFATTASSMEAWRHGWVSSSGLRQESERRAIMEFQLPPLSQPINDVQLQLTLFGSYTWYQVPLMLYGYAGDGVPVMQDAALGGLIWERDMNFLDFWGGRLTVDVTPFIRDLLEENQSYAGFVVRIGDAPDPGFVGFIGFVFATEEGAQRTEFPDLVKPPFLTFATGEDFLPPPVFLTPDPLPTWTCLLLFTGLIFLGHRRTSYKQVEPIK